jgi:hypothetical protein
MFCEKLVRSVSSVVCVAAAVAVVVVAAMTGTVSSRSVSASCRSCYVAVVVVLAADEGWGDGMGACIKGERKEQSREEGQTLK